MRIDLVVQVFQFGFNPFQFLAFAAQFSFVPFLLIRMVAASAAISPNRMKSRRRNNRKPQNPILFLGGGGSTVKIGIDQLKPQMGEEQHTDAERHIGEGRRLYFFY